jgi:hypothetical protein
MRKEEWRDKSGKIKVWETCRGRGKNLEMKKSEKGKDE